MRKKVGIALSGGAARGFAHLGVLKVLKEQDIPIDFIAGTSAGSFVGGALAAGMSVENIIEIGREISWFNMSKLSWTAKGLISNEPIADLIRDRFPFTKFEDLMTPFAAIVTDLDSGEEVVLKDKGDLAFAICASCAIPGIYSPLEDEKGKRFIDGGVVANLPTRAVKEMGADIVIGVDVLSSGSTYLGTPKTMFGTFFQSAMILFRFASSAHHFRADSVIVPQISHLRPDEIGKIDEFIELGEIAAREKIGEIKELIK